MADPPAVVTCSTLIKKLCADRRRRRVAEAERVLDALRAADTADVVAYSTLINGYCCAGRIDAARHVIDSMPFAPNAFTYNPLIRAYCVRGQMRARGARRYAPPTSSPTPSPEHIHEAIDLFNGSPSYGCTPDAFSYTTVLKVLLDAGQWEEAEELMAEMVQDGCPPNVVTFTTLISSLCQKGLVNLAL